MTGDVESERTSLPISALQHLLFCERQCALIHIEQLWAENRLTVEGHHLHERAHHGPHESRPGVRITRGMALRSDRLAIHGKADVVEMSTDRVYPIEYKRGKPKSHDADRVQLCAQAMCLEEMLDMSPGDINEGALFYGKTRRRQVVMFDKSKRQTTEDAIDELHEMIASRITPRAERMKKCDACSLFNLCLPDATAPTRSATRYFNRACTASLHATEPPGEADTEEAAA